VSSAATRASVVVPAAPGAGAWLAWLAAGFALATLFAGLAWFAPRLAGDDPVCALRRLAGVPCPTCGLTRALAALAAGDWRYSLALHPWALALVLQAVAAWGLWAAWLAGRLRLRPDRWLPRVAVLNVAALGTLWLARLVAGFLPG
jgi:hypothetical protein